MASPGFATCQQHTTVTRESHTSELTRLDNGITVGVSMAGLNVWTEQRVPWLVTMYQTTPRHDQNRKTFNVKFTLQTGHEDTVGDYRYSSTLSLFSALDGVGGKRHAPVALPQERPGSHCIGGWVVPRAGLDGCGKFRTSPGIEFRTVQAVASRCID